MKKLIPILTLLFVSFTLSAQYKKASFFEKEGRTYELGSQLYALGKGKGSPVGFKIGFGRDRDGKQFFSSWEIQYIPSYKYTYTTTDQNDAPVRVDGKTRPFFIYAPNYGYYLLSNKNTERKVKPFVMAGINVVLSGGIKTETTAPDNSYGLNKESNFRDFTAGIHGALGCVINFTEKYGLKIQGGYNYILAIRSGDSAPPEHLYDIFTSHLFASLSFRLRIMAKN